VERLKLVVIVNNQHMLNVEHVYVMAIVSQYSVTVIWYIRILMKPRNLNVSAGMRK